VEGESLYPPAAVAGGFAHPEVRQLPCVSGQRVLRFRPTGRNGNASVRVTVALPAPASALKLGWSDERDGRAEVRVRIGGHPITIEWIGSAGRPCREGLIQLPVATELELESDGGALDYLEPLEAAAEPPPPAPPSQGSNAPEPPLTSPERKSVDN
jgi:hypothetical protein